MDQCRHCIVRGNLKACMTTPCSHRETWIFGKMKEALLLVEDLINSSNGVYGLHLNGDPAPWDDLLTGGWFEGWLGGFDEVIDAIHGAEQKQPTP